MTFKIPRSPRDAAKQLLPHLSHKRSLILPMNEAWTLTGSHIEEEIVRLRRGVTNRDFQTPAGEITSVGRHCRRIYM
jgi:hypothetical protein